MKERKEDREIACERTREIVREKEKLKKGREILCVDVWRERDPN